MRTHCDDRYLCEVRPQSGITSDIWIIGVSVAALAPYGKFKKYFQMRQLSENTFQSFNIEVYEKFFFQLNF